MWFNWDWKLAICAENRCEKVDCFSDVKSRPNGCKKTIPVPPSPVSLSLFLSDCLFSVCISAPLFFSWTGISMYPNVKPLRFLLQRKMLKMVYERTLIGYVQIVCTIPIIRHQHTHSVDFFTVPADALPVSEPAMSKHRHWQKLIQTGSEATTTDQFGAHIFRLYDQIAVYVYKRVWVPFNRHTPRIKVTRLATFSFADVGPMLDEFGWELRCFLPVSVTIGVVQLHRCSKRHQATVDRDMYSDGKQAYSSYRQQFRAQWLQLRFNFDLKAVQLLIKGHWASVT